MHELSPVIILFLVAPFPAGSKIRMPLNPNRYTYKLSSPFSSSYFIYTEYCSLIHLIHIFYLLRFETQKFSIYLVCLKLKMYGNVYSTLPFQLKGQNKMIFHWGRVRVSTNSFSSSDIIVEGRWDGPLHGWKVIKGCVCDPKIWIVGVVCGSHFLNFIDDKWWL